jgi:hypothetical protein
VGDSIGDDETATSIDDSRSVVSDSLRTESIITQDEEDDEDDDEDDRGDSGTEAEAEGGLNDRDATREYETQPSKIFILVDEITTRSMVRSKIFKMFECATHNRDFKLYVFLPKRALGAS